LAALELRVSNPSFTAPLAEVDPEIAEAIELEKARENSKLEMIAAENFVSRAVLEAQGSILTNKYAENYPGRRYYGGCEFVDIAERLAIERAKQLFNADHANVQPHSGSQANMAVYFATMEVGDTYLAMNLEHGGHLTHGRSVNFSGKLYNAVHYGVDRERELIDYDEMLRLAREHRPKLIVGGATAYPRIIDFQKMREIADGVGAYLMIDMAHIAGLVSAGEHPSPVPCSQFVTTTTHKTLRGPRAGLILCQKEFAEMLDRAVFPGMQGGPLMHVIAAKAVCLREAMTPEFKVYQRQIRLNATALAERLMENGIRLVSGGTDNHLMLLNLIPLGVTGRQAQDALDNAGITTNLNTIPFDPQKPYIGSGIRIGTPALTTRGMREDEMRVIGDLIHRVLIDPADEAVREQVRGVVRELCGQFPLYG